MRLTKKQAIKFRNNPNVNPFSNNIFTQNDTEIYKIILDAYCNFMNDYLEKIQKKPVITKDESYYCDNFSNYNNNKKQIQNRRNDFIEDCSSDTEVEK